MKRLLGITIAILAVGVLSAVPALATKPDSDGQHQVWVCKYVGQPGDFETLKPGKNPIIVDVAAADDFVGADFADGQTHSKVIDLATDANTGQGERYIGEATCPTPSASTSPTPSLVPSPEPSASPIVTPEPSATPTPSDVPTSEPSVAPTPSTGPALTLPPTDTE